MRECFCLWFVLALVSPAEVGNKSYAGLIVKGQNNGNARVPMRSIPEPGPILLRGAGA